MCRGLRLNLGKKKPDDYFQVTFDHFWSCFLGTRCQFHQNLPSCFFCEKLHKYPFCAYILGLHFFVHEYWRKSCSKNVDENGFLGTIRQTLARFIKPSFMCRSSKSLYLVMSLHKNRLWSKIDFYRWTWNENLTHTHTHAHGCVSPMLGPSN